MVFVFARSRSALLSSLHLLCDRCRCGVNRKGLPRLCRSFWLLRPQSLWLSQHRSPALGFLVMKFVQVFRSYLVLRSPDSAHFHTIYRSIAISFLLLIFTFSFFVLCLPFSSLFPGGSAGSVCWHAASPSTIFPLACLANSTIAHSLVLYRFSPHPPRSFRRPVDQLSSSSTGGFPFVPHIRRISMFFACVCFTALPSVGE